ncbi:MAG: phospholipid carrier-dependent glycosyltransferase [Candidatus Brocadiia bacterium]|jgi:4-amino-4-deoxy-L-arabinose transferase-like glycosyltransferase
MNDKTLHHSSVLPLTSLRWALLGLILLFVACETVEVRFARTLRGDETLYIQAAYTMMETGDWLTPRFETGELRFNKPILPYWVVGIPLSLFGLSLSAARLPSVALALAALPFVYGLARVLVRDRAAALFAVAAYLTTEAVYSNAHQARTDSLLTFCVVGAMYFFARLIFEPACPERSRRGHERRDALLAYGLTACALITKGMVGIVLILLPVAVFLLISRKAQSAAHSAGSGRAHSADSGQARSADSGQARSAGSGQARSAGSGQARWRILASPWGWALLLLITVPWYAVTYFRYRGVFTNMFFEDQVTENLHGSKWYILGNVFQYLWLLLKDCLPWSAPAVLAVIANDGGLRATFKERRAQWLFLLSWLGVTYAIVLFGNVVRDRYLLPALPAVAVLAGLAAAKAGEADARPRGFGWGLQLVALCAFLMGLACLRHVEVEYEHPDVYEVIAGLLLMGGAAAIFRLARSGRMQQAALCGGALMMIAMLSVSAFFIAPAPMEPAAELAREKLAGLPAGAQVATVGLSKQVRAAVLLNCGLKPATLTESKKPAEQTEALRKFLQVPGEKFVLMDSRDYTALAEDVRDQCVVAAERSATEERDLDQWLHESPRSLAALIRGTQQTLYLLRADH